MCTLTDCHALIDAPTDDDDDEHSNNKIHIIDCPPNLGLHSWCQNSRADHTDTPYSIFLATITTTIITSSASSSPLLSCLAWLNALLQHPHRYTVYGPLLMSLSHLNIKILKFCCKFPNVLVFGIVEILLKYVCCMNWSVLRRQRKRKTLGVDSIFAPRTTN